MRLPRAPRQKQADSSPLAYRREGPRPGLAQCFRDRAILFGVGGVFLECRIIDARNVRRRFEFDPCDGKSLTDLFEGHACPRLKMNGRETSARKLRGQRHCKAPGMGRAELLFRVGGRLPVL